jgi:hypothetical protein
VVVAGRDDDPFALVAEDDAARALANLDRVDDLELLAVDDGDGTGRASAAKTRARAALKRVTLETPENSTVCCY